MTSHMIDASANKKAITGEQLWQIGDIGRVELVKGQILKLPFHEHLHASKVALISFFLNSFVVGHKFGRVLGGGVGVFTHRNPDTVRGLDVAYISNERMIQVQEDGFLNVAPELIIEIMSHNDRWTEIQEKLVEYFNIGVQLVWLVDPQLEQVHVYRSLDDVSRLTAENTLTAPEILPGFSVPISEIFELKD